MRPFLVRFEEARKANKTSLDRDTELDEFDDFRDRRPLDSPSECSHRLCPPDFFGIGLETRAASARSARNSTEARRASFIAACAAANTSRHDRDERRSFGKLGDESLSLAQHFRQRLAYRAANAVPISMFGQIAASCGIPGTIRAIQHSSPSGNMLERHPYRATLRPARCAIEVSELMMRSRFSMTAASSRKASSPVS